MKKEIIVVFKELLADSSVHGIPRLVRSKSFLSKVVWTFFFTISFFYCVFVIFETIFDFLEYKTVISFDNYPEVPSLLPAITICNLNPYQTKSSLDFVHNLNNKVGNISSYQKAYFFLAAVSSNDSLKKTISVPFKETLINCRVNGLDCNVDDFQWQFLANYGNCYRFNSGNDYFGRKAELKYISKQGKLNGLSIELYIGNPESIPEFIQNSGIHVFIGKYIYFF
jgi:hypothetical protein